MKNLLLCGYIYTTLRWPSYYLIFYYVITQFHHSEGAVIRVVMSAFAGIIFLIFRRRFKKTFADENLWLIISLVSIKLLPLAFFYSTFIDRIAIFFIPLQLEIISRVPLLIYSNICLFLSWFCYYDFTFKVFLGLPRHTS